MLNKILIIFFSIFTIFVIACSNNDYGNGKPAPELTFSQYYPLSLNMSSIEMKDIYKTKIYKNDVSGEFILPLDLAFKRYISQRLHPVGIADQLIIKVEHSYIKHDEVFPKGTFWRWSKVKVKDRYEAYMKLRLFVKYPGGVSSSHSILEVKRYILIPQRFSLAQRELAQIQFIELFIKDTDEGLMKGLKETLKII